MTTHREGLKLVVGLSRGAAITDDRPGISANQLHDHRQWLREPGLRPACGELRAGDHCPRPGPRHCDDRQHDAYDTVPDGSHGHRPESPRPVGGQCASPGLHPDRGFDVYAAGQRSADDQRLATISIANRHDRGALRLASKCALFACLRHYECGHRALDARPTISRLVAPDNLVQFTARKLRRHGSRLRHPHSPAPFQSANRCRVPRKGWNGRGRLDSCPIRFGRHGSVG